ncbi:MAG: RDD family protein [Planctomycetaceae bacterium]
MSIRIRCICTWEGNINESLAGKKVRCPDCRGAIQVPPASVKPEQLRAAAAVQTPVPPPAPAIPQPRPAPVPQPRAVRQPPPATLPPGIKSPAQKPDPIFDTWDAEILSDEDGSGSEDAFQAPPTAGSAAGRKSGTQKPLNPWMPPGSADAGRSTRPTTRCGANPLSRLLARIVEVTISFVAMLPGLAMLTIGGAQVKDEGPAVFFTGMGLLLAATISLAVFQIILFCHGKSIGKKLLGLTVCDAASGLPAGFMKTFAREILPNLVSFCVPVFGVIAALVDLCFIFSSDHRRLVDKVCETVVVAD